ncbi:hypothetical protein BTJ40_12240 [Microbulbifer sp. A4B17]|uniref:hypothetical protein n=1 Tax=Microbulbifer sp. A4B17 TaxID=359370 RepID=UPI000D52C085|nr:hypothetical protein [Microbulbifer sp. A4B17]AWF81530.1 hypothetical protein BTJ40_12240 [Microbulbifer sp. A4B17]
MSYRTGPGLPRTLPELWQFVRREFMSIEQLYTRVETDAATAQSTADQAGGVANDAKDQANSAAQAAADAQSDADVALADLDNISADGQLHPNEKLTVIREYNELTSEQAGIVNQAVALGVTTEKDNYANAVTALTNYLGGLSPNWNDTTLTTTVSRSIWNSNWEYVYEQRQILLNTISAILKQLADSSQSTANGASLAAVTAQATADNAQLAADDAQAEADDAIQDLENISADSQLHPSEKIGANREYNELINEQTGIENQASALGISTEKNSYTDAVTALTNYLLGLTPTWNATHSTTPITRSTWNSWWQTVYVSRQGLLNKIASVLQQLANAA